MSELREKLQVVTKVCFYKLAFCGDTCASVHAMHICVCVFVFVTGGQILERSNGQVTE